MQVSSDPRVAVPTADRVTVRGLRAFGRHGVLDFERTQPQPFVVDLTCWLDSPRAAQSDDLAASVHYGVLAERVAADIGAEPLSLIEALAERIARTCLSFEPVTQVEVTVHKPKAPVTVQVDDVSVTVTRSQT